MQTNATSGRKRAAVSLLYRAAKWCVQRIPRRVLRFRPFGVYEIPLDRRDEEAVAAQSLADASLQIDWIADRDELAELTGLADEVNLQSWNGATRRVAVARTHDQPIGVAWIATESFAEPDLGLSYRLQPDDAWLFAAVVDPQHRRQGVYTALLRFLIDELADERKTRLLLGVATGNEASRAAHSRVGAVGLGAIFAAACLGFGFCFCRGKIRKRSHWPIAWRHEIQISA